jgi:homocysteine S-methyltransferase
MRPVLRDALRTSVLTGDGAMGTYLHQLGHPIGVSYEEFNMTRPETIAAVHRQYYEAGARVIETNTFSANAERLARYGLEDESARINREGVRIAREAVGADAWVVGAVGAIRTGRLRAVRLADIERAFAEQIDALLEAGVDGILLETFYDLDELLLALRLVRERSDTTVICQLAAVGTELLYTGLSIAEAFRRLEAAGADAVGFNCESGPNGILHAIEALGGTVNLPISVYPNAGGADYVDGRITYAAGPEYFGDCARRFAERGARLVGGCCGTTPEHIRAIASALAGMAQDGASGDGHARAAAMGDAGAKAAAAPAVESRPRIRVTAEPAPSAPGGGAPDGGDGPTLVELVRRRPTVIVELDPPRDLDITKFMAGARALRDAGADALTMADNSLAVTRMSNLALGAIVKERVGIRPLVHVACRDRNLIGTQSHMMGLHALGIDHVLAVTGDPAKFGDLPGSSSVYDLTSFDMIRMIKQLNEGIAFSGKPLRQRARFVVGAAFNPNVKHLDKAVRRLEKKVECGADFIMTQPVYDAALIERIADATRHLGVPIFIGIMPLASGRNAEFLHNEVPGIELSDEVRRRMAGLEGEAGRAEGVRIAEELLDAALQFFNGIYLMTPFMFYDMTARLTGFVRARAGLETSGISCSSGENELK